MSLRLRAEIFDPGRNYNWGLERHFDMEFPNLERDNLEDDCRNCPT